MGKLSSILILSLAFIILGVTIVGSHGILYLTNLENELQALESENYRLQSNIAAIKDSIYAVQYDPLTIEKHAREELGLIRENEVVYVFPSGQKTY